jgi:hypothetical protein
MLETLRKAIADHAGARGDDHRHHRVRSSDLESERQGSRDHEFDVSVRQLRRVEGGFWTGCDPDVDRHIAALDVPEGAQLIRERVDEALRSADDEADATHTPTHVLRTKVAERNGAGQTNHTSQEMPPAPFDDAHQISCS